MNSYCSRVIHREIVKKTYSVGSSVDPTVIAMVGSGVGSGVGTGVGCID